MRRTVGYGAGHRRRTLQEEVDEFLRTVWSPTSDDIRVEHLVELAERYLGDAAEADDRDALVENVVFRVVDGEAPNGAP